MHHQGTMDNPPNPQHQEDGDSKGGKTNNQKTRGKKRAGGTVGGYKRPVFARYHEEGTDPNRQTPNRNGNLTGDNKSDAKAKDTKDSGEASRHAQEDST